MAESHNDIDALSARAAAFLLQAVQSDTDPGELARELITVSQEPSQIIFAARMESTAGPAAFLIYLYLISETAAMKRYAGDLATLQVAAERDTPGPRPLAHAESADYAFILATTPATFHALSGGPAETTDETDLATLIDPSETDRIRRETATTLLKLLRAADAQATIWQAAMQAAGVAESGEMSDEADHIPFNDAETELALFLLDERSIKRLLQLLNLMVSAAASVTGRAPD